MTRDNKEDVRILVEKYRQLKALINGDALAADSVGAAGHGGSFSLRSMRVTISGSVSLGDSYAQAVLAHELYHAVQVCQFPAARTMLQAIHGLDRWVTMVFLSAATQGKRWSPGDAILQALATPDISEPSLKLADLLADLVSQPIEVLIESLSARPSGLSLLDLIEGAAYAVEQIVCRVMGVTPIERPDRYMRAWREYVRCGGRDLQTFAMLVHVCLREGSVFGYRDSYYPHAVDIFEHLVTYSPYFETGDQSQVDMSKAIAPPPPITGEDSYRVIDHDLVALAGRSKQRFTVHLDNWDPKSCAMDFERLQADTPAMDSAHSQWSEDAQDRAQRIVKRLFMSYTRGATAFPTERTPSDRFIVDQFIAHLQQQFGQLHAEAFIWEIAGSRHSRATISHVVRESAPAQIKVRLFDEKPPLMLDEYFELSQRILDFESVLMLESIDANFENDEDPTPWIVACCPGCFPESCGHQQWSQNLVGRPTPLQFYGACSCASGLPATFHRTVGKSFLDLIN